MDTQGNKLQKMRERVEYLYNYSFESTTDLVEKLKPITDKLFTELDTAKQEKHQLMFVITEAIEAFEKIIKIYKDESLSEIDILDTAVEAVSVIRYVLSK